MFCCTGIAPHFILLVGGLISQRCLRQENVERPFAVAVHKASVYWDDTVAMQVLRIDKTADVAGHAAPITNATFKGLVDLKIYGHWTQKGSNACGLVFVIYC